MHVRRAGQRSARPLNCGVRRHVNVIEFVKEPASSGGFRINIRVDGRLLAEIMRDVEAPMAKREGHPSLAGGYSAIGRPDEPGEHYVGRHWQKWGESERKTVL